MALRVSTVAITALMLIFGLLLGRPAGAQEPVTPAAEEPVTPTAQVERVLTTAGWLEPEPAPAADVEAALVPVDCAGVTGPVIGFDVAGGQDPAEVLDFTNDLAGLGFSLGTVDLSSGVIPACVNVLIVQGSVGGQALSRSYTAADGALLQSWTAAGHSLLLSGEFDVYAAATQALFQAYGYSQVGPGAVTDPTDADPLSPPPAGSWVIYQADNFAVHPILAGVTGLELLAGSPLSSGANAVVMADADAQPPGAPVMAAFEDGNGCVVMMGDSNWNAVVGSVAGYQKVDNALVAKQAVQWLADCVVTAVSTPTATATATATATTTPTATATATATQPSIPDPAGDPVDPGPGKGGSGNDGGDDDDNDRDEDPPPPPPAQPAAAMAQVATAATPASLPVIFLPATGQMEREGSLSGVGCLIALVVLLLVGGTVMVLRLEQR